MYGIPHTQTWQSVVETADRMNGVYKPEIVADSREFHVEGSHLRRVA